MEKITFQNLDAFHREPFAARLTKAISTFYPFVEGAYVLSLNAKYGSGKSTFLQMWKNYLEPEYKVIYLNAWETDFDEDPINSIISSLLMNISSTEKTKTLRRVLHGTIGVAALVSNDIFDHLSGVNVKTISENISADFKKIDLEEIGKDIFRKYNFKVRVYKLLKASLEKYINTLNNKPLIIMIDELDRVRPDYAVKFLEAIKHIFSVKGVCFVLGVDRDQLKNSVKQLYGDIEFENYYRRFVTREVNLEMSNNIDRKKYVEQLSKDFFDEKSSHGIKFGFKPELKPYVLDAMAYISRIFNLTPRNTQYLFRIFIHFLAADNAISRGQSWLEATIFLIATYITNSDKYHKIGNQQISASELNNFVSSHVFLNNTEKRYLALLVLAFNLRSGDKLNNSDSVQIVSNYDNLGIPVGESEEATEVLRSLGRIVSTMGIENTNSTFNHIYNRLEDWRSFID